MRHHNDSNKLKSRFESKRLKHVVSLRQLRIDGGIDERPYVGLENIESRMGRLLNPPAAENGAATTIVPPASLSNVFEPGDVLFAKLRPFLAKAWVADFSGQSSIEFLVMRPVEVEPRFLLYICLWNEFVDTVDASTFGSKVPRAEWDSVGNVSVPVPDRNQQRAISAYLDRETAQLDDLVAEQERLLSLLEEKRKAFITNAVTRGVNPNVSLRDSGITWLGDVPARWDLRKIAWLFCERDQRGRSDLPLLEVSLNAGVVQRQFAREKIESTAPDINSYKVTWKGDVVFNKMRMWQGAVGVAPVDGLVSPDYIVAEPTGSLSSEYAGLLFGAPAFSAECARRSHGKVWDRRRLHWAGLREIAVPVPPLAEQTAIVNYVRARTSMLDELISATETSITLVQERRKALIAAAVTGQIAVQDVA